MRHDVPVAGEHLLEAVARRVIRVEAEDVVVVRRRVTEAEAGDEVVLVEGSEGLADDADGRLVGVGRAAKLVQALSVERPLP